MSKEKSNRILHFINNPHEILPAINRKIFSSRLSPKKIQNGVVTWNVDAGFDWGDGDTPPQVAAINYHMVQALRNDLRGNNYEHAVEIGCGYGRVTPWLSEFAKNVTGIDPNNEVLSIVDRYYPDVKTICAKAQDLPLDDECVDLIFTRSVLQHIPPKDIQQAVSEIVRISEDEAHILICEATTGQESQTFHPRSEDKYSDLFEGFEMVSSWRRKTPAKRRIHNRTRMLFERSN